VHAGPAFDWRNSLNFADSPQPSFNRLAKHCCFSSLQYLTSSRNWVTKIKELLIGQYMCDQYGNNTVAFPYKLLTSIKVLDQAGTGKFEKCIKMHSISIKATRVIAVRVGQGESGCWQITTSTPNTCFSRPTAVFGSVKSCSILNLPPYGWQRSLHGSSRSFSSFCFSSGSFFFIGGGLLLMLLLLLLMLLLLLLLLLLLMQPKVPFR
jgi:hypothetical protein